MSKFKVLDMIPKVSASILAGDFANLEKEIKMVTEAGADYIHIDVMDGVFVPNITIGQAVVKSLRPHTHLPFDVHLMITNPEQHIKAFADAGADIITIHSESTTHLHKAIQQIKSLGKKAGISIVPSTNEAVLEYLYDDIDLILVMTVNPGFGGQNFIHSQLNKINNINKRIKKKSIELSVDGGINTKTAQLCVESGANVLVAGSFIFNNTDYKSAITNLKNST
jgi:ribulose-phosphate 3-epimerase